MANSLLDSILGLVTPEMKQSLASRLGETPDAVQNGLGLATGATLGSLASKAGDASFMDKIVQMAHSAGSQNVLSALPSVASGDSGGGLGDLVSRFLPAVFGSQQGALTNMIEQRAGVRSGSGIGILKMAIPLILGYLGKLHATGALTPSTLSSTLKAEAPSLSNYLPAADALRATGATARESLSRSARGVAAAGREATGFRWGWVAAIAGLALLAFLLLRPHGTQIKQAANDAASTAGNAANNAATAARDATTSAVAALGDSTKVVLPDGTELQVPANGVEARLVQYLHDTSTPVGEVTWFDFDRLTFDTGAATLQPASDEQLNNVAIILKAYPTAKIRLGGYTDNTGNSDSNQRLSQDRAQSVMAALMSRGIDSSRLSAQGYGAQNPVADNSTEEGRQKNRRISIRVAEK